MFLDDPADAAAASPIRFVAGSTTPFYMAHGGDDFAHIARSNAAMAAALSRTSALCRVESIAGRGHFDMALELGDASQEWVQRLVAWVRDGASASAHAVSH